MAGKAILGQDRSNFAILEICPQTGGFLSTDAETLSRPLLKESQIVGVFWGNFAMHDPEANQQNTIELMEFVVEGSKLKLPKDLAAELPRLLWLHMMSVVLFWIHDRSPGCERSYAMAERTGEIVARLVGLAKNPLLAPLRKSTLRLLEGLSPVSDASDE